METKVVYAILISTILGGVIGFSSSYAVFNSQIQILQSDLTSAKTNITNLQSNMSNTKSNLSALNSTVNNYIDLSGWLPEPAYDSGWVSILDSIYGTKTMIVFNHGLNTSQIFVHVIRNSSKLGIIFDYWTGARSHTWCTMYYNGSAYVSSNNEIAVYVNPLNEHPYSGDPLYDEIRVMIWKIK